MIRSLARVRRGLLALIVRRGKLVVDLRHHRQDLVDGRAKNDAQTVVAGLQRWLRVDAPGAKHVVGTEDQLLVEIDLRVRVETFEDELDVSPCQRRRSDFERRLVLPILLVDPLLLLLVVAIKRIVDQLVCEQVRVDATGHGGAVPVRFSDLTKLPAGVNLHDCFAAFSCLRTCCNECNQQQDWTKPRVEFCAQGQTSPKNYLFCFLNSRLIKDARAEANPSINYARFDACYCDASVNYRKWRACF